MPFPDLLSVERRSVFLAPPAQRGRVTSQVTDVARILTKTAVIAHCEPDGWPRWIVANAIACRAPAGRRMRSSALGLLRRRLTTAWISSVSPRPTRAAQRPSIWASRLSFVTERQSAATAQTCGLPWGHERL